jgi:hypothetical protein
MSDSTETLRIAMNDFAESFRAGMNDFAAAIRAEIRAGDEETRRQMRVLHAEVIARFDLLEEHLNGRKCSPESGGRTGRLTSLPETLTATGR